MANDYRAIRAENERRYGTDIGEIGPMLLAERYADRTHFIYELLQNAEDALSRRPGSGGARSVSFHLTSDALRVSHHGKPFDERDVRGICGIAKSTKQLTDIGRFGIGFKSVYAFTDLPEVHSGDEDFAIENFVWPKAARPVERCGDETIILLPLRDSDSDQRAIENGLRRLGARALLFLRQINEIEWDVEGGPSGIYLRDEPETLAEGVRRVSLIGQEQDRPNIEEDWLVFSRPVSNGGLEVGNVEIAFSLKRAQAEAFYSIVPVAESQLVAFFPTALSTNLGFLVQGPYRTTPSRDNVASDDSWNTHLVGETVELLVGALRRLRDFGMLDAAALNCLPIERARFGETNMFAPLFDATRRILRTEALLPRFDGGHVQAANARLARTQELRELISTRQLGALYGRADELIWLAGDITQDRMPTLRQYLIHELEISEVTPEVIAPRLTKAFLESQTDDWILRLYRFLGRQPALLLQGRLNGVPLVRLTDGTHVRAKSEDGGMPLAFLPGEVETSFPTVRQTVCATGEALKFLKSLGLTVPDAVDDVIWHVLPKYAADHSHEGGEEGDSNTDYEADIRRILNASRTDSAAQRVKLLAALHKTPFVMAVDSAAGVSYAAAPEAVYLATERLKSLFSGVPGVMLVDDDYPCLRGESLNKLLEACGAARYLKPVPVAPEFTWEEKKEMRRQGGEERTSGRSDRLEDWTLEGLDQLLSALPRFEAEVAATKAKVLWEALGDVAGRRGPSFFTGTYRWSYYGNYMCDFEPTFVRRLNETAWIPTTGGRLEHTRFVVFDTLGWKPDPFLQSKILFEPPIVEMLARELGIERGALDLLRKHDITSEAKLRELLGLKEEPEGEAEELSEEGGDTSSPQPAVKPPPERPTAPTKTAFDTSTADWREGASGTGDSRATAASEQPGGNENGRGGNPAGGASSHSRKRTPGRRGERKFISYVAASPDEEVPDPDGLDQAERMALEAKAVEFILSHEPEWQREPPGNTGFDLSVVDEEGWTTRWCEVKAMTGSLEDRPVGLKRAQFECARQHGDAYWLYVVEHAGGNSPRIVRIQDPAGKARTFTFDRGWLNVAETGGESESVEH